MFLLGVGLLAVAVALASWYGGIWIERFILSDECWPIVRRFTFSALALMFLSGLMRAVL